MDCPSHKNCSAPICSKDDDTLQFAYWFPDEEICNQLPSPLWVKNQRKIRLKAKNGLSCFTYKMLNRNITIKKGITGIDPDKEISVEEGKWIKKHPVKKEMSEGQKAVLREKMLKMKERVSGKAS